MIRRTSSGGHKRAPSVGSSFADTSATVTKKGSLRIKRLTFADAGMYTCLGELSDTGQLTHLLTQPMASPSFVFSPSHSMSDDLLCT